MAITLLAAKDPKWFTLQRSKLDENGDEVKDENGNTEWEDILDENGNPKKLINIQCQWSHLGDESQPFLNFIANPEDPEEHGRALYAAIINGDYGTIGEE